ncbi:MAG: oligoendopeptidase F [Lachnospiraceae bacterium]|nr:oligoendopeptidase F [Lachnospiraceae bacterium]
MSSVKKREEIDKKFQWAMEDMCPSDLVWEEKMSELKEMVKKYKEFEGTLAQSADRLLEFLRFEDEIGLRCELVYVYANQKLHENMAEAKYQDYAGKAQNIMVQVSSAGAFAEPEILDIPEDTMQTFFRENTDLQFYETALNRIRRKKEHCLSEKEEKIIAKTGEMSTAASDIFDMFNDADAKFGNIRDENGEEVSVTHGRYISLMESQNREVRKAAFQSMYKTYMDYRNTLGAMYAANAKQLSFYAKVRNYNSSLEMQLADSNIPVSVYENLIEAVHEYLPAMYKYVNIRKRALGVEELHMYDVYAPITKDVDMKIPYEEAKKMVKEGLAPMGEEYLSHLQEGFDHRWIDVYENQGKRSGAYSWGIYGVHPYVLLNYQENLNNVFTLAHEMGHALHSYYSDSTQPYTYAGYKIFVAEVASTCNESLLIRHLLSKCQDKQEKIYLLNYFIDQFKGTMFRQTMFAEFEKITHEMCERGETLNADSISKVYYELNQLYFGESMVSDEEIAIEWARIPHFYTPFYVYQYATGFAAAIALSGRILELGERGVNDYMKFLTGGSSKDPIELLKMAGVDMTEKRPVRQALEMFSELVDELDKLIQFN